MAEDTKEDEKGYYYDFGRFYLSFTPKILEDGTQNDHSLGIFYTNALKMAGEIRFRSIETSGSDLVWGIADSRLTGEQKTYEVFLLPLNYHFFRKAGFTLRAGAGVYYNYNKSESKG